MDSEKTQHAVAVKDKALSLGFDACGIAAAGNVDPEDRLGAWLSRGCHAGMAWLERNPQVRQDVRLKLPGAKSVVVVCRSYYAADEEDPPEGSGRVARYARGRDYHKVLARPVRELARYISTLAESARCYCSVDTGPVLERAWAQKAGIGWIGKNGSVIREGLGSWFFLGLVATTLDLEADDPALARCGSCRRCLDVCPTGALVAPQVLDARKCLSYLTIEHRGPVPEGLEKAYGDCLFGCDACQEACPWNRGVKETTEDAFKGPGYLDLEQISRISEQDFESRFAGSPIRRAKWSGIQRTVGILRHPRQS